MINPRNVPDLTQYSKTSDKVKQKKKNPTYN